MKNDDGCLFILFMLAAACLVAALWMGPEMFLESVRAGW